MLIVIPGMTTKKITQNTVRNKGIQMNTEHSYLTQKATVMEEQGNKKDMTNRK